MTEPAQAKPRRRRRWLIVTVALVLLASVSWWYWPRVDRRLVGRWRLEQSPGPTMDIFIRRNGSIEVRRSDRQGVQVFPFRSTGEIAVIGAVASTSLRIGS